MLNQAKSHLLIFDNFQIDADLPKFKKLSAHLNNRVEGVIGGTSGLDADQFSLGFNPMPISFGGVSSTGDFIEDRINQQLEMSRRLWKRIFKKLFGWAVPKPPDPKISALQFFKMVKDKLEKPEVYAEKINEFIKVAEHAKSMGQVALYEEIKRDINIVKKEALLLSSSFYTCITEQQIVQFYKESDKGLSLHYIKNFGRVIPKAVCDQKIKADELCVFDNYVVLHYDKDQKSFKETHAEREKRKDPILFGVISGTRKLYYIADWIDEYCDLTIKQLVDKFGQDAITANDITVKYKK